MDLARFAETFFNAEIAARSLPHILSATGLTVVLALAVVGFGISLGMVLAILRSFRWRVLNFVIVCFSDIFRALPPLMVIIVLYFAFPFAGLPMSSFTATWLSLGLVLAGFAEEIFWAGILSVGRGQWEASRATGMSNWQTLIFVVLPQAVRLTVPPITNRTIAITKGTALGSVVALPEILGTAHSESSLAGNPTPLTMAAIAYLIIFIPVVALGRWSETRFKYKK